MTAKEPASEPRPEKFRILLVDDLSTNIKLLARYLQGYQLYFALDGPKALALAQEVRPDIILLDVMMPEMDGYEVCRHLKEDSRTADIPVIFVTARSQDDDEELGLMAGAVDFIAKPVNGAVLRARLRSHLELKEHRDNLSGMLVRREEELRRTYEQLLHAEKLTAIGKLSSSISHEFSSPLLGIEQILKGFLAEDEENEARVELLSVCVSECVRLRELIRSLQKFGRPTSARFAPIAINEIIADVLQLSGKHMARQGVNVVFRQGEVPKVRAVEDQLKQVVFNLLTNACDAMAPDGGTVEVVTHEQDGQVLLMVRDEGCGIPPEKLGSVFAPFYTTKEEEEGTGLGLSNCFGIITRHQGMIHVESELGQGSLFTVELPSYPVGGP
ncbi:MAG: ATP-binding protein [Thermodesulfobacteriota bacterium]